MSNRRVKFWLFAMSSVVLFAILLDAKMPTRLAASISLLFSAMLVIDPQPPRAP